MQAHPRQEQPVTGRGAEASANHAPLWMQRLSLIVLVLTCLYLGLLLLLLPWSPYWSDNHLLALLPEGVKDWLSTGAAKGLVSGLGLLDIWIGLSELVHWRGRRG